MAITIRIQYKGDAARKLAADEYADSAKDCYKPDMIRALGLFAIPPPDDSKAIWKSGFILCHYHIVREAPLFDKIYRGAFRAQSIACRATLDGLSISYIHLFENGKQIQLGPRARQRSADPPGHHEYERPYVDHRNNEYSQHKFKPYGRPLGPERSLPEISSRPYAGEASSRFTPRSHSLERAMDIDVKPTRDELDRADRTAQRQNSSEIGPGAHDALKKLAESQSFLALLGQNLTANSDPSVKQEPGSSAQVGPSGTSQPMFASTSGRDSFARPPSDPRQSYNQSMTRPDGFPVRPLREEYSLDPGLTPRMRRVSLHDAPSPNGRGRSVEPPYRRRTPPPYEGPHGTERRPNTYGHRENHDQDPNAAYKRHSFTEKQPYQTTWNRGYKRPFSPNRSSRRSVTPPAKRRYSVNDNLNGSYSSRGTGYDLPRFAAPNAGYARPASPFGLRRSPSSSSIQGPPGSKTPSNSSVIANDGSEASSSKTVDSNSLNRELWDIRRQITALKAREEHLANELKARNAPELSEKAHAPKVPEPEERLRLMEGEILTLRARLQSEVSRRQLVEDACDNERRRRKLAEGALDDARREYSQPLVVPAMMDAFEKIAQLTGDAMINAEEPTQAQKDWPMQE